MILTAADLDIMMKLYDWSAKIEGAAGTGKRNQ